MPSIRSLGGFCHVKIHMVKKGDTLYDLSKKYGISLEKLIEANPQLQDPNMLNIGDKVKIPSESTPVAMPENVIHKHVVKQGDSLWQLSKAWGVTLREMIDANPQLKNPNALLVGEVVNIPKVGMKEVVNGEIGSETNVNNKITQGGKTNTGPKVDNSHKVNTAPIQTPSPVIPQLPQLPENVSVPNVPPMPNIAPVTNPPIHHVSPQPVQMPIAANPSFDIKEEKVEMTQHLFIQYSVPAQEAMGNAPMKEKSNLCPQMPEQAYPGIVEGYSWNQPQYEQPSWEPQGYGQQQPNWAQPQFMEPCYPEMPQMVQQGPNCCHPNFSPWSGDVSGYGQGFSPLSNNAAPIENVTVTCSNVYSCTPPYEWTYPESMMPGTGGMNSALPVMPFEGYGTPYSQPVVQGSQNCGCNSRESSVAVIDQDVSQSRIDNTLEEVVIANHVSNSELASDELANANELKKAQTSGVNKGKSKSAKEIKPKTRHKRRNPWIKN